MADPILVDKRDGVATITFNRPQVRNAIDQDKIWMLQEALATLELDRETRVIVLTGAGDNFLAGGDVTFFEKSLTWSAEERRRQFEAVVLRINPVMLTLRRMPQPVIASVRGAAAGWGVSLVMASDLAIAAEDARFVFAYTLIGACPEGSGSYFLPRTLGAKKAMELALLSERVGAAGGASTGPGEPRGSGRAARRGDPRAGAAPAAGPTLAYGITKRLINRGLSNTLEMQLQAEAEAFAECATTEDFAEGVRAFLQHRKPSFAGR